MKIIFTTILILFSAVVPSYSEECEEPAQFDQVITTLPIFVLESPTVNPLEFIQTSQLLLGSPGIDFEVKPVGDSLTVNRGSSIVEMSTKSGGIWFADKSQLWNPKITPNLSADSQLLATSDRLLNQIYTRRRRGLSRYIVTSFSNFGKTVLARYEIGSGNRKDKVLDSQVNYVSIVKPFPGRELTLPIVGGGGELNFSFGDQGKLIGHSGVWRDIKRIQKQSRLIPKAESDNRFKERMEKMQIESFRSYLAYYSAPSFEKQDFLYPVYVYDSVAKIDNESVPLKTVILPATRDSEFRDESDAEPSDALNGRTRPDDDNVTLRPGSTAPERDDTEEGEHEVGVSWYQGEGLFRVENEANDFLNEMTSAGWVQNFNWGDDNAWERDWNANDDLWADAADFVYYAGHASSKWWQLRVPDNGRLKSKVAGLTPETPGDLWGDQDLEWIIISACGPLHDDSLNGGGSVFDRWKGVFDGLHQLLGYAATVFDYGLEGKKVAEYMKNGDTIIDSWFRTAREVQDSCNRGYPPNGKKIYAGVIYAEQENAPISTREDHLWGVGTVAADPKPAKYLYALWTST